MRILSPPHCGPGGVQKVTCSTNFNDSNFLAKAMPKLCAQFQLNLHIKRNIEIVELFVERISMIQNLYDIIWHKWCNKPFCSPVYYVQECRYKKKTACTSRHSSNPWIKWNAQNDAQKCCDMQHDDKENRGKLQLRLDPLTGEPLHFICRGWIQTDLIQLLLLIVCIHIVGNPFLPRSLLSRNDLPEPHLA